MGISVLLEANTRSCDLGIGFVLVAVICICECLIDRVRQHRLQPTPLDGSVPSQGIFSESAFPWDDK